MKLKRLPDDFRVTELADFSADGGPFALYILEKRSLGTLEAVDAISRKWNVPRDRIAFGGLKDKHAISRQFLTIQNGPPRNLRQSNFELFYQGQALRAFSTEDITGNRFEIVLRDLAPQILEQAISALHETVRGRVPNYFDDQRFGSLGESGEFIALPWCKGDYERALWLALADANLRDNSQEREEKHILREYWGDWRACAAALGQSQHRNVINFLAHNPRNFRNAITYIPQELRSLYLAAFQSHLWNEMLAAFLREQLAAERLGNVEIGTGTLPFYREPGAVAYAAISTATLPLPSARLHLEEGPLKILIDGVLNRNGLELREMRVKYPRDSFFSKGDRAATFSPANLAHNAAADDLYPGRQKLCLSFDLPRGSYATILVKRIMTHA